MNIINTSNTSVNDGWNTTKKASGTKVLSVSLREEDRFVRNYQDDELVKEKLAHQLLKELIDSGYILWAKTKHPGFEQYTEYNARLSVADVQYTNMFVDDRNFSVNGVNFSHNQVKEAVLNTFPEYLL